MHKKAQGISMNVIIIAAIALLVLVVLSVIFLGKIGSWGSEVNNCENKHPQARCMDECPDGMTAYTSWNCPGDGDLVCCVPLDAS